jgi:hypothetical protein
MLLCAMASLLGGGCAPAATSSAVGGIQAWQRAVAGNLSQLETDLTETGLNPDAPQAPSEAIRSGPISAVESACTTLVADAHILERDNPAPNATLEVEWQATLSDWAAGCWGDNALMNASSDYATFLNTLFTMGGTEAGPWTYNFYPSVIITPTPQPPTPTPVPTPVPTPIPTPPPAFHLGNPRSNDGTLTDELYAACDYSTSITAGCEAASIKALDTAMTEEGLTPTAIPEDFWSMPYDQQLLLLINGDRTARNLPTLTGPVAALDVDAEIGAGAETNPTYLESPYGWNAAWAEEWNTVADEFVWMYDDGWGGTPHFAGNTYFNSTCTAATAKGCWGDRADILYQWAGPVQFGGACAPFQDLPYLPWLSCGIIIVQGTS